jgi:hypothetical protein
LGFDGVLRVDDPDGIVVDACFAGSDRWDVLLGSCAEWVREPLADWLLHRWGPEAQRQYAYDVLGARRDDVRVVRTSPA